MSHHEFKKISEPIEPQEASPMKPAMTVLGIAIAKHVLHAVGMENTGEIVFRKRFSRHDLMPLMAKLPVTSTINWPIFEAYPGHAFTSFLAASHPAWRRFHP